MNGEKSLSYSDLLGFRDFAIFCGAGISKNSGLPLANELKQSILERLPVDKKDMDEIMNSILPFEAFIETLSENTDISKILDIFEDGKPNTNHILISKLAKNSYFKTIFTTNFDLLIERALEKEGLKKDEDFKVYCDEEQFSRIDFKDIENKIIRIFKIHGSIEDKNSIRTTLKAVADRSLSDKRMNVIRHLFSAGNHKKVLIFGYSCSDWFDITPQIQNIEKDQKEVIFVEHLEAGKEEIEDIKIKDRKNPFKKFSGWRIKCNTDKFIERLWSSLEGIIGEEYALSNSETKWEKYVDEWGNGLEENKRYLKYFIAGFIFLNISNFNRAIEYFKNSLGIAKEIGDMAKESGCYINLGATYYTLGDFSKTIDYFKMSLKIVKSIRDKSKESACYVGLGAAYHALGDFNKAFEYYEKALEIIQEIGDKLGESRCYANLGNVYYGLGDFKKAIEYHEKALEITKAIADKTAESRYYANLGNAYCGLGDFKKAIDYYEKALEITKIIGNKGEESGCYVGLGNVYDNLEDFKKAIEYHEKALEIAKAIADKTDESRCYTNLGNVYYGLGDFKKAIEYHEKALEIAKAIGNKGEESANYVGLGNTYRGLNNFTRAIEYYEKALEIKKEIGDKSGESKCYANLGAVYHDLRDIRRAIEYLSKAKKIFEAIGQIHYLREVYSNLYLAYKNIGDNENAEKYKKKLSNV